MSSIVAPHDGVAKPIGNRESPRCIATDPADLRRARANPSAATRRTHRGGGAGVRARGTGVGRPCQAPRSPYQDHPRRARLSREGTRSASSSAVRLRNVRTLCRIPPGTTFVPRATQAAASRETRTREPVHPQVEELVRLCKCWDLMSRPLVRGWPPSRPSPSTFSERCLASNRTDKRSHRVTQSGTTAVASISTFALSSISAFTSTAVMAAL